MADIEAEVLRDAEAAVRWEGNTEHAKQPLLARVMAAVNRSEWVWRLIDDSVDRIVNRDTMLDDIEDAVIDGFERRLGGGRTMTPAAARGDGTEAAGANKAGGAMKATRIESSASVGAATTADPPASAPAPAEGPSGTGSAVAPAGGSGTLSESRRGSHAAAAMSSPPVATTVDAILAMAGARKVTKPSSGNKTATLATKVPPGTTADRADTTSVDSSSTPNKTIVTMSSTVTTAVGFSPKAATVAARQGTPRVAVTLRSRGTIPPTTDDDDSEVSDVSSVHTDELSSDDMPDKDDVERAAAPSTSTASTLDTMDADCKSNGGPTTVGTAKAPQAKAAKAPSAPAATAAPAPTSKKRSKRRARKRSPTEDDEEMKASTGGPSAISATKTTGEASEERKHQVAIDDLETAVPSTRRASKRRRRGAALSDSDTTLTEGWTSEKWFDYVYKGIKVQAMDGPSWYDGKVASVDQGGRRVEIKFDGWGKKHNRWFEAETLEVRVLRKPSA